MQYHSGMNKVELQKLVAKNLHTAMERKFYGEVNQSALARMSNVSQKTISNILSACAKSDEDIEALPSTSIAIIATLADTLGLAPWVLLHPDPERAAKLDDMYKLIETDIKTLPPHAGKRDKLGGVIIGEVQPRSKKQKVTK